MSNLFLVLAILYVLWGVVSSIVIVSYLSNRGVKINYVLIKLFIIKYVHQYRLMTTAERGAPGFWYYSYVGSMFLALGFAIVGMVLRAMSGV